MNQNNNSAIFKQAKNLLKDEDECFDYRLKQACNLMDEIEKQSGLMDWVRNPMLQTVLSLLNPLIGKSYKIEQAIKLLLSAFADLSNK